MGLCLASSRSRPAGGAAGPSRHHAPTLHTGAGRGSLRLGCPVRPPEGPTARAGVLGAAEGAGVTMSFRLGVEGVLSGSRRAPGLPLGAAPKNRPCPARMPAPLVWTPRRLAEPSPSEGLVPARARPRASPCGTPRKGLESPSRHAPWAGPPCHPCRAQAGPSPRHLPGGRCLSRRHTPTWRRALRPQPSATR